jgi:LPS sulfotransferase NodH
VTIVRDDQKVVTFGRAQLPAARSRLGSARAYLASPRGGRGATGRFIIVTSGRAGSELLVSLLHAHPEFSCDGEILNTKRQWPDRFLDGRAARAAAQGKLAYGCKVQPQDILDVQRIADPHNWLRRHYAGGWRIIHLLRRNRLHQAISVARATQSQWHYRRGEAGPAGPMTLDPNAVIGTMYLIQHKENQIAAMLEGVQHLELWYEDDLEHASDQSRTVATVCQELGIMPQATTTELTRVTPPSVRDSVANYDEIADTIRANAFTRYLEQ